MLSTDNVTLSFGSRVLFQDVSIKFVPGNCYGLIGANGAGKSTFLKILSGEIEADQGEVAIMPGARLAKLNQDQFAFDEYEVLETVLMGNKALFDVKTEKDALYAKADFTDEDGIRASELEAIFAGMEGWNAESDAGEMLESLGIRTELHTAKMSDLEAGIKVRVLLAQALFGNPDVLLLDEPTNNLDMKSIAWLEEFLADFKNTVIVVSHDRHFLDKVCTHMADIDYGKIQIYTGNYSFWYQSSQMVRKQVQDRNKKAEDRAKELKEFIARFSANAAKSKQATSRKKLLDKLNVEEIKPSNRKYPHIHFPIAREAGKDLLRIENLSYAEDGKEYFNHLSLDVLKGDKVAFVGRDGKAASMLFEILVGERQPTTGEFRWGITTSTAYFPKEHESYFRKDQNLIEWLRQYAMTDDERDEVYLRGFFGKMLFSGQEVFKNTSVLSGGEKVRCLLARMMFLHANVLILNEPTNHLDLESITALNNGLMDFPGTVLFISQDREFVDTIANRIIEVGPNGIVDKSMTYSEYITREDIARDVAQIY